MPDIGCVLMYGGEGDQTDPVRNPVEDHQCIAFGCPDPDGTLLGGGGLVRILHRRTLLVPVGAEHAAIAALRFHGDTTRATLVEVDAVVGGHRLRRIVVTGRARDRRNKLSHSLGSSLPYQLPSLGGLHAAHEQWDKPRQTLWFRLSETLDFRRPASQSQLVTLACPRIGRQPFGCGQSRRPSMP